MSGLLYYIDCYYSHLEYSTRNDVRRRCGVLGHHRLQPYARQSRRGSRCGRNVFVTAKLGVFGVAVTVHSSQQWKLTRSAVCGGLMGGPWGQPGRSPRRPQPKWVRHRAYTRRRGGGWVLSSQREKSNFWLWRRIRALRDRKKVIKPKHKINGIIVRIFASREYFTRVTVFSSLSWG